MDHLKTFWAQLIQFPPTTTTVVGLSLFGGLIGHAVTGSWEWAGIVTSAVGVLCPQDAAAVKTGIDEARKIATTPVA